MLKTKELFDLSHTLAGDYLAKHEFPWQSLSGIKGLIISLGKTLDMSEYVKKTNNPKMGRPRIKIDKEEFENEIKALQDCTVITVPYESSSGERGAISVFGPTRMEYNKIIPLLEYIAKNIKNIV